MSRERTGGGNLLPLAGDGLDEFIPRAEIGDHEIEFAWTHVEIFTPTDVGTVRTRQLRGVP